jgi:peptide/nickel transport system permease protein
MQYFIIILFTISLNFFLPRMMPGDPLKFIVGEDIVLMSSEQKAEVLEKHGLNKPVFEQYLTYMGSILKGDLGYSYRSKKPVADIVSERLPWTLLLSITNIIISTIIGVVMGTWAAWNRGKKIDIILNNTFVFFRSMPSFWIGMIFIAVFGARLGWLPIFGAQSVWARYTGFERIIDITRHLIMPTTTLVILSVSSIYLTMRYSMIDVLGEDYILMAKMKGLSSKKVRYTHAMRNALIPVVTIVMLNVGYMVGGATIIETVFSYPGMGRLLFEAVTNRDYPVIQGCFFMITICVIAANIIADLIYPLLDPRVV